MKASQFTRWIAQLSSLSPEQREQLKACLSAPGSLPQGMIATPSSCPHCQSSELQPWGSSGGLSRYRCKSCGKTSNPLTGTAMARLRKRPLWQSYAEALTQSLTVRGAAKHCGVSKNTAFLWRHRFLTQIADHQAQHESGIVEADETFFLESFKGQRDLPRPPRQRGGSAKRRGLSAEQIPVLVVRDRSGQHADFQLEKLDAAHVRERLHPLIDADAILCTDSAGVYAHFAKAEGITHRPVNPSQERRVDGPFHIQNVNAYDSRLKSWMIPFHGVATKYLTHYLGWRRLLERYKTQLNPLICLREALGRAAMQQLTQT
ncbi:IS1595 family transposase [Azotobacter chroococcum subsp. isscasi]|uniref:IS1595 family transposase n=1 Tax=Azotobacter chroococcum TaxID=353 RepID=UPI0010407FE2|nr:IS1595 family transposase [Azotobacter chroococcum]TBW07862.1 IS1595 family transposase [Azotobacter chroococcum subsp. isscasi]